MNMLPHRRRNGVILLQTLVMSVMVCMIAVMVLKWVLSRYMLTSRDYRSSSANVRSTGYAQQRFAFWNFNTSSILSNGSSSVDSKTVDYKTSGPSNAMRKFTITIDEDQ